ncbi:hypothetical protein C488_20637 [Natrinema pellirubrum DSM 15624]|jgi:hypothetical protein|uniref:Domain of unknown function domain-containing protein n=1 Tax=Natrinema pellirubrum (strain DSM 15624 / CIP 106293 / JCM 10476 / NCIMB 786 / 157) TaxID=797303 RepID=L0JT13_NATP1|nr:hypothetical protein [Natrinema pellirubrum]AGB33948.1 hypothetical protein Natpe_4244 [Natrinema pellirubrum DSM 15624]ELY69133.1 hypothetical protein C488_20637 [Natrinema pellirubrum DSM 15624]
MSEEFDWVERDRGVLTKRDREILLGQSGENLDKNAQNVRRYNIRERIKNSLYDFHIIAQNLPLADIQQLFEPAYDWSRERRQLDEEGRTSAQPDIDQLLWSWLTLFEFFSYGMYAGGKQETQVLMQGLVEGGIERGYREYQHDNLQTYREIDVDLGLNYGNLVLRNNYLRGVQQDLPSETSEIAKEVLRLRRLRKISQIDASRWFDEYVRKPEFD